VPTEDILAIADACLVQVYTGQAGGLAAGSTFWEQDTPGIPDSSQMNDRFGNALAWGDFNGDGFSDLAIGVPGQDLGNGPNGGMVIVIYGSATGLDAFAPIAAQVWHQDVPGVPEDGESGDRCGWVVTVDDFNGDGFDDLTFGCPGEGFMIAGVGVAITVYGSGVGLDAFAPIPSQLWLQDTPGIADVGELSDHFSQALTTGDFNGDTFADLAVGVPGEDLGGLASPGAVNVIYGSAVNGLDVPGNQFLHQATPGILGSLQANDHFGSSVASGDFNADGVDDLAVGVPNEDGGGGAADAGAVNVVYGATAGLNAIGNQLWHQNSAGMAADGAEAGDLFGWAVASCDCNGDGFADLAVGVPSEDVAAVANAGAVDLLLGSAVGLSTAGNQFWHQGLTVDAAEQNDFYGMTLAVGDFNADGLDDLAGGAPGDDSPGGTVDAGGVSVLNGDAAGLTAVGNQYREQDAGGEGAVAAFDGLGAGIYGP